MITRKPPESPEKPDNENEETPETPEEPRDGISETPEEPSDDKEIPEHGETVVEEPEEGDTSKEIVDEEDFEEGDSHEEVTPGDKTTEEPEVDVVDEEIPGDPTTIIEEEQVPVLDEEGNPVLDDDGNLVYETIEEEKEIPGESIIRKTTTSTQRTTTQPSRRVIYVGLLEAGVEIIEQEGLATIVDLITTTVTENGVVVNQNSYETVIQAGQDEIVRIGIGLYIRYTQTVKENTVIKHGYKEIADTSMWEGEEFVKTCQNGNIERTYVVVLDADRKEISRKLIDEVVVEPVFEERRYGTKPIVQTSQEVTDKTVPFEREYVYVDSESEYEKVITKGVNGNNKVTTEITTTKGVETVTVDEPIPFKTKYVEDPNMYLGEQKVEDGVIGKFSQVYETVIKDGVEVSRKLVDERITVLPKDEIIYIGTKEALQPEDEYDLNAVVSEFHRLVNNLRAEKGLNQLGYYSESQDTANKRAYEIRRDGGIFSHTRPNGQRHSTIYAEDIAKTGHNIAMGENIEHRGWMDGQTANEVAYDLFMQFVNSPGHYLNMLDDRYTQEVYGLYLSPRQNPLVPYRYINGVQTLIIDRGPMN